MHGCVCLQQKQIGSVSAYSSCWVELKILRRMLWLARPILCFINCLSGTVCQALSLGQRGHLRFILDSRKKRFARCMLYVIRFSSNLLETNAVQLTEPFCQPSLMFLKWP